MFKRCCYIELRVIDLLLVKKLYRNISVILIVLHFDSW